MTERSVRSSEVSDSVLGGQLGEDRLRHRMTVTSALRRALHI
jgi:hypothetical protein